MDTSPQRQVLAAQGSGRLDIGVKPKSSDISIGDKEVICHIRTSDRNV